MRTVVASRSLGLMLALAAMQATAMEEKAMAVQGAAAQSTAPAPPAESPVRGASDYDRIDHEATVLRVLSDFVLADNEGVQHSAMLGLRALRDPALRPLFERLCEHDSWTLRVDGVLGLAELDGGGTTDLARIERLPGERDREAAINGTLSLQLASAEQVRTMLGWNDLPSSQRALLAGELRRLGGTPETPMLVRLAKSRTPEVAGLALAILLDMEAREAQVLEPEVRSLIAALPVATRSAAIAQIADTCAAYELEGAGPFVASLLSLPDLSTESRMRAIGNLLIFAPTQAFAPLADAVHANSSQGNLFRYSSILIASGATAAPETWALFRNGDSMMETIADAGVALSAGRHAEGYAKLIGLERLAMLRASLDGAKRVGTDAELAFGRECLRLVLEPGPTPPALSETLLAALFRLAELEPEQFRESLALADLDTPTRDAMLLSLLNAGSRSAAEVARTVRGSASRLGEGQIAVLAARHSEKLEPSELDELMLVSGGAVNVGLAVRVQAAWLWMRHSGKASIAIERLAPLPETGASGG